MHLAARQYTAAAGHAGHFDTYRVNYFKLLVTGIFHIGRVGIPPSGVGVPPTHILGGTHVKTFSHIVIIQGDHGGKLIYLI